MMEEFYTALIEACLGDGTLVTLTGDSRVTAPKDMRIGRTPPIKTAKYPFLGFSEVDGGPALIDAYTGYRRTVIEFECLAKTELLAIQIADRLEELLHSDSEPEETQYWDISDLVVLNHWTHFLSRTPKAIYDERTDSYTIVITAEFRWNLRNP